MAATATLAPAVPQTLTYDDMAAVLRCTRRHVGNLDTQGRIPRPFRINSSVRWRADEIQAWLAAGAPPRAEWEARYRSAE